MTIMLAAPVVDAVRILRLQIPCFTLSVGCLAAPYGQASSPLTTAIQQ